MGVCNCSMFCCMLLYVHSSTAIILMGKRELIALLNLSSWCLVIVEWLFLAVPWGCLRFVIVAFPDHTHLLFFYDGSDSKTYYPPTKSEGYSFCVVRASVHSVRPSGTISQYLLVRFDSFLLQMISTMNSRYSLSLVNINSLTLELLPLFKYRQL